MPTTKKPKKTQVKRLIGFVHFFRNFMPDLGTKILPFYNLFRKQTELVVTNEHYKKLEVLKIDLSKATELTLRLPKPGLQYVILCEVITVITEQESS